MLLVVVGAGLVAGVTADRSTAQRAERAAAGHRGTDRAARRRTAHRADGFTAAHAGAGREAEHAGHRTNRYHGLQHMHLLVKRIYSWRRVTCSREEGRSRTGRGWAHPAPTAGCSPSCLPAGDATAETFPCQPPGS